VDLRAPSGNFHGCFASFARDLSGRGLIDGVEAATPKRWRTFWWRPPGVLPKRPGPRTEKARRYVLESYTPERLFEADVRLGAAARNALPIFSTPPERMEGVPFAFPANPLSRRRAAEWLAVWGAGGKMRRIEMRGRSESGSEACCPLTSVLRRLFGRK